MTKQQLLGAVRHALTFGGGYLVAKGFATHADLSAVPNQIDTIIASLQSAAGGIASLIGVGWSIWEKIERPNAAPAAAPVDMTKLLSALANARKDVAQLAPTARPVAAAPANGSPAPAAALPPGGPAGFINRGLLYILGGLAGLGLLGASLVGCALVAPTGPVTPVGNSTVLGTAANGNLTVTLNGNAIDVGKVAADASTGVKVGLTNGIPVAVSADPSLRQDFVAAQEGLTAFIGSGKTDPTQLLALVNQGVNPANQAKIDSYINGAISAWQVFIQFAGPYLSTSQTTQYALEFLNAANAGLTAGLAASPASVPTAVVAPPAATTN